MTIFKSVATRVSHIGGDLKLVQDMSWLVFLALEVHGLRVEDLPLQFKFSAVP